MAEDPELPRAVALAWGIAATPQRGPKRELSVERIVEAAVALADAGGLASVSMSSVATSLGVTPMALYRYISAQDDLVTLMQEAAIGTPPATVREATGWRDGLTRWSHAQTDVYRRHPWMLDISIAGTPMTPNNLAWMDAGLAVLAPTGLDSNARVAVALLAMGQIRWQGVVERGYLEAAAAQGSTPDEIDAGISELLGGFVTAEQFPEVRAALDAGAFGPESPDPFAFGLERLLDGIQSHLDRRG